MTKTIFRSFAIAALASVTAAPVLAADMDGPSVDGIRGYKNSGVVAVPAPIPYTETYKWYLRGDIGNSMLRSGTMSTPGLPAGVEGPEDWGNLASVSGAIGRYITPSLRAEFSIDYRRAKSLGTEGLTGTYDSGIKNLGAATSVGGNPGVMYGQNTYAVSMGENATYQNSTFLVSAFYELPTGSRFKPYIGAGIGVAVHELSRVGSDTYSCTGGTQYVVDSVTGLADPTTAICNNTPGVLSSAYVLGDKASGIGFGLAAQLSAGLTYDITNRIHLDTNYRFMWQSGRVAATFSDGSGNASTIKLGDRIDHELRTGLRFDLY